MPVDHAKDGADTNGKKKKYTKHLNDTSDRRRARSSNPLRRGIQDFIAAHISPDLLSKHGLPPENLEPALPKRFTVYEPLLLLPVNALSDPPAWGALYASLDSQQRQALYGSIAKAFGRVGVTHVAMNAPIALTNTEGQENRMRSPAGLIPLYGDFGPAPSVDGEDAQPTEADLQRAFWVRTMQNQGIVQTWAPLYTMFSRGNITEKARILGQGGVFEGLDAGTLGGERVEDVSVVDMYAGIGYFVFSYLKRGVKRVWGWEINGWSVEGLRRGCAANGWGCRVVQVQGDGSLSQSIPELVDNLHDSERVVVFHGDNRFAVDVLSELKGKLEGRNAWNSIRHVNLGLLPSSSGSWGDACKMIDLQKGGWIHVHENVDIREIDLMKDRIVSEIGRLRADVLPDSAEDHVGCPHIEQVKTYAPGIMHCVFDIKLSSLSGARLPDPS
ncbi:tRNA(Phe) (4-demethylwyosine(37)-C(7)) aminocarboxypropyltransferase [Aspergillus clavatus NRRL 1]|uniref:tRNA wybutosine-synthesizing protein 2 n=1 Tax=Aspergillus clavatus (strain ATCC 1007 / CBS 513.65 / DSM 816 / NCTC 3887 / NRRL 1 / QM 1276 / 107) TaxID=344612 RepID=A1CBB7_ASPCL|nr:uncharacterized protein ACLA_014720 [Aspergillus clavatus NRRL 1]EAW13035.1 conserved hypothetical protein [Aspergillus clavatus NRRL 1]